MTDGESNGRPFRRVLVVEDEMLIALLVEDFLLELGCEVVGPATRLPRAMRLAQEESFDFAILDVNLAGQESYPVAEILRARGIPYIFASGYGATGLAEAHRETVTLKKPYEIDDLRSAMLRVG